ncbi:hypothetical protein HPB50_028156 [Hyalomma asiaticum]|nr:hypothetical protein HPB50_028156 [Hyalomma asiaticum]
MPPGGGRKRQGPSQLGGAACVENDTSQVARFYDDREVFITGGTGFIGKMFERLKQEQPCALEKVTAVAGDLSQPGLGLSASDLATLVDNVSVVFHSGATVKFTEPIRNAFELNVLGTRRVLDICKQMSNIRALVHVSTAYCNCDRSDVHHEAINRPSENIREYFEAFESAGNYPTDVNKECLFGHPNTYTLTKNFAESLVLDERGNIPVAIVRPSIVTAALKEPLPGWVDNYSACTGIVVALGLGLLPSMITEKKHLTDIVPVDIVANTLICVAWHTSTRPSHVKVYHCASGTLQQHTWGDLVDAMQKSILRYPLPNAMCYPKFSVTNSHLWHNVNLYCLRYLPTLVADLCLTLLKREPRFVKLYKKARKSMDVGEYFLTRGWLFTMDNVVKLARDLTPKDKQASLEMDNAEIRTGNERPQMLFAIRSHS